MIFAAGRHPVFGWRADPAAGPAALRLHATLAGLVLSPGGVVVLVLIPIIGRILPFVQTRYLIGFGFLTLGCAYCYRARRHARTRRSARWR